MGLYNVTKSVKLKPHLRSCGLKNVVEVLPLGVAGADDGKALAVGGAESTRRDQA